MNLPESVKIFTGNSLVSINCTYYSNTLSNLHYFTLDKKRKLASDCSDCSGLGLDSGLDGMEDSSHETLDNQDDSQDISGLDSFSEPNFLKSKSDSDLCATEHDTAAIKSEIFDPSYDFHQNFIEDNGLDFRNSMDKDSEVCIKDEPSDLQFDSDNLVSNVSSCKIELAGDGLASSHGALSAPLIPLVNGSASSVATTAVSQPATAMAHIVRVEPGADGKGYVLHLSIPSLGIGNFILYTNGLPNLQLQQQLLQQGSTSGNPVLINSDDSQRPVQPITTAIGPLGSISPQEGAIAESDPPACVLEESSDLPFIKAEETHSNAYINIEPIGSPTHSSLNSNGRDLEQLLTENIAISSSGSEKEITTKEEELVAGCIAQFVICSDGPMKCELCSFQTDSYSSFKSHIICSHPCWRITKKLSKNRLLVEQSVKASHLPTTVSMRQSKKSSGAAAAAGKKPGIRNKRVFQCKECARLFVFEGSIINHLRDFHSNMCDDPYECIRVSNDHGQTFDDCSPPSTPDENDDSEPTEVDLDADQISVCRCQICGFTAMSNELLNDHAKRIHSKQVLMFGLNECVD